MYVSDVHRHVPPNTGSKSTLWLFNTILEALAIAIRHEKERKGLWVGKEEIKIPYFSDNVTVYIQSPKEFTRIT